LKIGNGLFADHFKSLCAKSTEHAIFSVTFRNRETMRERAQYGRFIGSQTTSDRFTIVVYVLKLDNARREVIKVINVG